MKYPLNWTPTQEQVEDAQEVLGWAYREMMNELTPELGKAQIGRLDNPDGDRSEYDALLFTEGAFNAADTLGEVMIAQAWRRHPERREGAE